MSKIPLRMPQRRSARPVVSGRTGLAPPPLEAGDQLRTGEFLRRYEGDVLLKKAQLIEGIVHMPSPVRATLHAIPDGLIQGWLGMFAALQPGLETLPNATLILDSENAPQPDSILCSTPREGGRVWINADGYLCGKPELVCEIAASSASIDLHDKFRVYSRCGIQEYLVWVTAEEKVLWFELAGENYTEIKPERGFLRSRVFPGLVLDLKALLKRDRARLFSALQGN